MALVTISESLDSLHIIDMGETGTQLLFKRR